MELRRLPMEHVRERWLPLYQPDIPKHTAEALSHLFDLFRKVETDRAFRLSQKEATLSPNIVVNVRQSGSVPSPRQLQALKRRLSITTGGVFKLFGFSLDSMRAVESILNGARTRLIETYPFYRDRPIDLPGKLGDQASFQRTAFLSELVRGWQRGIPIRTLHGPHWQNNGILYGQLGSGDTLAMPKIPPGSFVAIRAVDEQERLNPDPRRTYFLQHGHGYLCCGCSVQHSRLSLITRDQDYLGPHDFAYPGQVRIVGRITSFGVRLPLAKHDTGTIGRSHKPAPLILPWEHRSFSDLLAAERRRFGITEAHLESASAILESQIGTGVSARTLRRYEHDGDRVPRTAVLLGITLVHSLRLTDVLRILNLWTDESHNYSLRTLMSVKTAAELSDIFPVATVPTPESQWRPLIDEWGEWPALLSMAIPDLERWGHRILRVNQSNWFKGLDPFISPRSVVVLAEQNGIPIERQPKPRHDWERALYALRYEEKTLCGYIEIGQTSVALVPHPLAASVPRLVLPRKQVQILGKVIGVVSPV